LVLHREARPQLLPLLLQQPLLPVLHLLLFLLHVGYADGGQQLHVGLQLLLLQLLQVLQLLLLLLPGLLEHHCLRHLH
jgi:hypothetical protein